MPSKKKKKSEIIEVKVSEQKIGDDPKLIGRRHFTIDVLVLEKELVVADRLSDLGAVGPVEELLKNDLRVSMQRYIDEANSLLTRAAALAEDDQDEEHHEEVSEEISLEEGASGHESLPQSPLEQVTDDRYSQRDMFSGNLL